MYVAVKGGERAIDNSHRAIAEERRGDRDLPVLSLEQIESQFGLAVDRVMTEGSLHDRELAALALKQARGDAVEAIFLLRAYRTTLPRFGTTVPIDTATMRLRRRVSATFKDLPGGQLLGPTYDYTHRLLDFELAERSAEPAAVDSWAVKEPDASLLDGSVARVTDILANQGLIEPADGHGQSAETSPEPGGGTRETPDITRTPVRYPGERAQRLQQLARADEGWLLGLAYSTQRGYGGNHPFAGEIRMGAVDVEFVPEELGFPVVIGELTVTECQMINQFEGSADIPPQFTRGYGLAFGHSERKTMAMALVDRALRAAELDEEVNAPAQNEEFVLAHGDNVEASGFVQHLKLPHYVDFQSELELIRRLRAAAGAATGEGPKSSRVHEVDAQEIVETEEDE